MILATRLYCHNVCTSKYLANTSSSGQLVAYHMLVPFCEVFVNPYLFWLIVMLLLIIHRLLAYYMQELVQLGVH